MKRFFLIALVLTTGLTGCSTMARLTGQTDDTVLPGDRENVLPQEQQTARDPSLMKNHQQGQQTTSGSTINSQPLGRQTTANPPATSNSQAPCKLNDIDCVSSVDQEATTAQ